MSVWNDKTQSDTNRLKAIQQYSWDGHLFTQPDSAFYFSQLQLDFATKKGQSKYIANALSTQGVSFALRGEQVKAIDCFTKSLKVNEEIGNKSGISASLGNIGLIYDEQGDYYSAIDYHTKSLKVNEEIGDKGGIAASLNNIGGIYYQKGDYDKALEYHTKSLAIKEEMGDKRGIASSLNNIGIICFAQNDYGKAIDYQTKNLKIAEEIGDKNAYATALTNIGNIYYKQDDYDRAMELYLKSLTIQEEIGDKMGISSSLNNIGIIYYDKKNYNKALEYSSRSIAIAKEIGYVNLISSAAKSLWKANKKLGKLKESLEMYELYITIRDSADSEKNQKAILQQEYQYIYEKQKALDDKDHEKQLAVEQEAKAKQKVISYSVAVGLGLVAIFLFFVLNRLKITRKQKAIIEMQKEIVEGAHQEIKDSITYAKRIQNAILPPVKLVKQYLADSFIIYKPKDVVAGDFYWMEHAADKVLYAAADCTGHGVPGAMVSVVCNNGLNRAVREYGLSDPGKILDKTREIVIQEFEKSDEDVKDGMDIALCSLEGMKLKYAGAHNPLWIIRKGKIIETKANKQPIGQFDNPVPFTTYSFELEKGDSIYIFSDGYVDQFGGEKGKKFKSKAFRELLLSIQGKSMEEQKLIIDETFETWKGDLEQIDDVCVIGVRV